MSSIKKEELFDAKLIFPIILIIIGIFDISHVSSYVRNYDNQFTSNPYQVELFEAKHELNQVDFFNSIFMLCTGFFVTMWGSFKFYLWFEKKEIISLIDKKKRKMKQYEYVEIILKEEFKAEFTQTDLLKYIKENKRINIDQTYISKLLKKLSQKQIITLTRIENQEKGNFAKKYYKLSKLEKWEDIFK